jgi:hypothetical protein
LHRRRNFSSEACCGFRTNSRYHFIFANQISNWHINDELRLVGSSETFQDCAVRKRVIIGVLAMIGVGVLVFVLSQPKKGSAEYHIREYRAAEREANGERTLVQRAWYKCGTLLGFNRSVGVGDPNNPLVRSETQIKALLDLGYLEKREFYLQNIPRPKAHKALAGLAAKGLPHDRVWRIREDSETYTVLTVEAEPRDLAKWEEMVRKVDVP